MPVEMFTGCTVGRRFGALSLTTTPFAALYRTGQLILNSKAVREFGVADWQAVQMGYDRDNQLIVIVRCADCFVEHAQAIIRRNHGIRALCVTSFVQFFDIPKPVRTQRYAVTYDSEQERITVDLKKEL